MKRILCSLFLALAASVASAEPAGIEKKETATAVVQEAAAVPATPACAAKSPASSFEYPTCSACSGDGCRGEYVGTICGLDDFGQLKVCQDQLVGCYPNTYPETIRCLCTADIVP